MAHQIRHLNEENIQKFILSPTPTLSIIDFWAPWCAPCKELLPILESLAATYGEKIQIGKIDVSHHRALSQKYEIKSIPTLLFFHHGKLMQRMVGLKGEADMKQVIDRLLASK